MEVYKIILLVLLAIVFIPTWKVQTELAELKKSGKTDAKKEKQLKLLIGCLVVIFLIALGKTMFDYYSAIVAARAGK